MVNDDNLPPLPLRAAVDEHNLQGGRLLYSREQMRTYAHTAILAERERWQQDALRYRWLRDTNMSRPDMTDGSSVILAPYEVTAIWYGLPEDQWNLFGGCLQCSKGERFDAAIDAAMKGKA